VAGVRQDLITATAATAALSSFLMGLLANLPVGLAPGLSLNAYVRASAIVLAFLSLISSSSPILSWDFMALE